MKKLILCFLVLTFGFNSYAQEIVLNYHQPLNIGEIANSSQLQFVIHYPGFGACKIKLSSAREGSLRGFVKNIEVRQKLGAEYLSVGPIKKESDQRQFYSEIDLSELSLYINFFTFESKDGSPLNEFADDIIMSLIHC